MSISTLPCIGQHITTRQPSFGKAATPALTKVALWSDFDGTWRDNTLPTAQAKAARAKLEEALPDLKTEYAQKGIDLEINYVTARSPRLILKQNLPQPGHTIGYGGSMIYKGLPTPRKRLFNMWLPNLPWNRPLKAWRKAHQASGFKSRKVLELGKQLAATKYPNLVVRTIGEVVGTPEIDVNPLMATLCITNKSIQLAPGETEAMFDQRTYRTPEQIQAFFEELSKLVQQSGMEFKATQPYPFSGRPYVMFDIAAPKVNKGDAIDFMIQQEGIKPEHVIIAGDGGNDIDMMKPDGRKFIVVGPNKVLREKVRAMNYDSAIIQSDDLPSSLGVLDGLRQHLDTIAAELQSQPVRFAGRRPQPHKRLELTA